MPILDRQPTPPLAVIVATAAVALFIVGWQPAWRIARNVVTIAHEGGHALVALLSGRRLRGIRLHSNTSGLTVSVGRRTGLGMVLTLLVGYLTPSLLGLAAAALLSSGRIALLLWIALVPLIAMLVMIRNVYGAIAVVVTGAVIFAVSWYTSPTVQACFAYTMTWFLLLGGVRPIGELQRLRRTGRAPYSDADQVARLTRVPGLFWVGLFGLVNLAALAGGGYLLL